MTLLKYDLYSEERKALLYLLSLKTSDLSNVQLVQVAIDRFGNDWTHLDRKILA